MKVILAGGGTGGHLYPAIAVAEELKAKGVEFVFMVSDRGLERDILTKMNFNFIEQRIKPFAGQNIFGKIKVITSIIKEFYRLRRYFDVSDKVILFGGFAAAVSGIIAITRGCDLYVHEQNSVMGRTNRFFAKYAKKVFVSFDKTLKAKGKIVQAGNPVRKNILQREPKDILNKTILLIGGSQGSRLLNSIMTESAKELIDKGYSIIHQTGKKLYNETTHRYEQKGILNDNKLKVLPYLEDINKYYEMADIIVSRAGSGSVFEIMTVKRPAVFVPLKIAAENHQYFNALEAVEKGIGVIIEEHNLDKNLLIKKLEDIYNNYQKKYLPKLKQLHLKDSVSIILKGMNL